MKPILSLVFAAGVLAALPVRAGEAADRLSKCLADSATAADRTVLVRWMFGALSAHPDLDDLVAPGGAQRAEAERDAAAVFERLIAQDCAAASRDAIAREGTEGYGSGFETLGELAMEGFVGHPHVQASMEGMVSRIDSQKILKALLAR